MASFSDIEHEISNILAVAEELPDDQLPVALDYLDALAVQEADKVDGISFVVRKRQSEIDWLKEEEHRIRQRRQSMESRLIQFKEYLKDIMLRHGLQKLRGNKASVFLRQSEAVHITDINAVPDEYAQTRIERVPDKYRIKEALKSGEDVPGTTLTPKLSAVIR
jgi:hypothetical protein